MNTVFILMFLTMLIMQDEFTGLRKQMVDTQIRARGVYNNRVLKAMENVPRHLFVPAEYRSMAYDDRPLPIGHGQTISQPYIVAFMTEAIRPGPEDKVLEIGTGSGYQAAVLAEIVDSVYTLEIIDELGKEAAARLHKLGYHNVKAKVSDGYYGWQEYAPFDAIIVTAAAEEIPEPLIEQLKEGGRMIIPVEYVFGNQELVLVTKKKGEIKKKKILPVRFVPFTRD